MKRTLIIVGVSVAGLTLFTLGYFSKYLSQRFYRPRLLVTVNSHDIQDADLKREMRFLRVSGSATFSNITREDVLDRMINDSLILAEAKRLRIAVAEEAVDEYLTNLWEGYSESESGQIMAQQQFSPAEWRGLIRRRLLVEETIRRAVEDQIHVGEDEIEEYYWTHLLQFYRQVRLQARQIVVETREQAETIKKQLDEGEDFQELARKYSRGPEKDQGGDLGWVGKSDLPQSFSRVLFQMRPKQISKPVSTQYGYHIFFVEKRERGGKIPLEEAKKIIEKNLRLQKSDRVFQAWLENLRGQASIVIHDRRGVE